MLTLQILAGLALLVLGGDFLVRGAVAAARRFGVSPLLIGLTLVGFGTSTPELLTSLQAAFKGSPGIAVGNVVGSNIANILLILGAAAVIYPLATSRAAIRRDGGMALLAAFACLGVVLLGRLEPWAGALMLLALVAYVLHCYRRERTRPDAAALLHASEVELAEPGPKRLWLALAMTAGGLLLTLLGAQFLVEGSIGLARSFGISEAVIGLTIVAVGTSLPELVTSVMAALRRHSDVAFGNVVGSNIYNVLGILGVTAVVSPLDPPAAIARFDIWVMLAATILLLIVSRTALKISRWEGGVFVVLYGCYLAALGVMEGL